MGTVHSDSERCAAAPGSWLLVFDAGLIGTSLQGHERCLSDLLDDRRREKAAMFNASVTRSAVIVDAVRQPTIVLECTSVTNAVYANPDHVGT